MKKYVILVLAGICTMSVGIGGMLMYFTDKDRLVNTTTVGNNAISIVETFEDPKPGEKTEKAPTAVNVSSVDCYVRARIFLSDSRASTYLDYYNGEKEGFDLASWSEAEDGWFYYNDILEKDEKTTPVFTHIRIAEDIPEDLSGFTIDVVFESVQVDGFSTAEEAFAAIQ